MPRLLRLAFAGLIALLLVGGPVGYKWLYDQSFRNFRVVEEGVLYRSAQVDLAGLKRLVHDHGIRTIVSLRDGESDIDQREEKWAAKNCLNFVRIPPRPWASPDGKAPAPAEEGLRRFRAVMDDPANHPVLIHCFAGIHRTGTYCAVYRMDRYGWKNLDAINEMRALGYNTLDTDQDVLGFLLHYQPATARRSTPLEVTPVGRSH